MKHIVKSSQFRGKQREGSKTALVIKLFRVCYFSYLNAKELK